MDGEAGAHEVLRAAEAIVGAYGAHDTERYFASFHPDATFIFHTSPARLGSRDEFRSEWERWQREDGFRVLACRSSDQQVQLFDGVAVFTHTVVSTVQSQDARETSVERETIVFARQQDGGWLAVHEHLSPAPEDGDA